jgi:hypothetical protein
MRQPEGTVWIERAIVALILASLAGTLNLVIQVHRRAVPRKESAPVLVAATEPAQAAPIAQAPPPPKAKKKPRPPRPAPPPPEDPTPKALAPLREATAREIAAARAADRRAASLEQARRTAVAESDRWKRRESLVRQQLALLSDKALKIDREVDTLAAERDVLARERDSLKAAIAKNQGKGSYAVLPYKGSNGTWRRPIVLECSNGTVSIRPKGPTFTMLDLSSILNPRSSPVILAIAREILRVQSSASPDGAPVVPYFVFLVRPDGIRPYYELRARLEPLGIAFGYELIEQNMKVDVPDFDDLSTWDGTIPLDVPEGTKPGGHGGEGGPLAGLTWSGSGAPSDRGPAGGARRGGGGDETPEDFVWPGHGTENPGDGPLGGSPDHAGSRGGVGGSPGMRGVDRPGLGGRPWPGPGLQGGPTGGLALNGGGPAGSRRAPRGTPGRGRADTGRDDPAGQDGARWPSSNEPLGGAGDAPRQGSGGRLRGGASGEGQGSFGNLPESNRLQGAFGSESSGDPKGQGVQGGLGRGTEELPGTSGAPGVPGAFTLPDLEPADGGSSAAGPKLEGAGGGSSAAGPKLEGAGGAGASGEPDFLAGRPGGGTADVGPEGKGAPGTPDAPPGRSPGDGTEGDRSGGPQPGAGSTAAARPGEGRGGAPRALGGMAGAASPAGPAVGIGMNPRRDGSAPPNHPGAASPGLLGLNLGSLLPGVASGFSPPSSGAGMPSGSPSGSPSGTGSSGAASGLIFGSDGDGGSSSGQGQGVPGFGGQRPDGPTRTIEVPFEIVVVCDPEGVIVHPGGYRLTRYALDEHRKDGVMVRQLLAVANQRAAADPTIRPRPRVKFLVENGGTETFWAVRKQVLFSGLNWPMSLQVVGNQNTQRLLEETW